MLKIIKKKTYSKSKLVRFFWLKYSWYRANKNMKKSDEEFTKEVYYKQFNKQLNLENPKTYDEKISWLKLHNRDPLLTVCTDKYLVRDYVQNCGLGHILTKLYGVYGDAKEIDFSKFNLPVFFKCNHMSGYNTIYYPDKPFDKNDFIKRFNFLLKQNYYIQLREWNYKNIKPKIIAEEVLFNEDGSLPIDYKFLCFNGEPKLLYVMLGICDKEGNHADIGDKFLNTYDMNFNLLNITQGFNMYLDKRIEKPVLFEQMKQYASILSKPFECCRVDLYEVKGKVYFGEITFYDSAGFNNIKPVEWDLKIGSWININNINTN